jgi:hypothetical protein
MSEPQYSTQPLKKSSSKINFSYPTRPQSAALKPVEGVVFSGSGSGLGRDTNFSSTREETEKTRPLTKAEKAKKNRYKRLKSAARLLPYERIAGCQQYPHKSQDYVAVTWNPDTNKTRFRGLFCCESSSCPHCVEARSERERKQLALAIAEARKRNWHSFMLTLTLSHHQGDALDNLLEILSSAFDKTFSGRWYQDFKELFGIKGKVKAFEYRYGVNGHHPHLHILFFYSRLDGIDLAADFEPTPDLSERIEQLISSRWVEKVEGLGGSALGEFGCDVKLADSAVADYITKWGREPENKTWGADSELAKSHKKGAANSTYQSEFGVVRYSSMSGFDLLGAAAAEPEQLEWLGALLGSEITSELQSRAGSLYVEFFRAFKGRPRLHWGDLKKLLNLDEVEKAFDEANPPEPDESFDVVQIPVGEQWTKITGGFKGEDLRFDLELACSNACSNGNPHEIEAWLTKHGILGAIIPDDVWQRFGEIPPSWTRVVF